MGNGEFQTETQALIDAAFKRSVAPALPDVTIGRVPVRGATTQGTSLVKLPVGWVLSRVSAELTAKRELRFGYLFEPLVSPVAFGYAVPGRSIHRASADDERGIRLQPRAIRQLVSTLLTDWPGLIERFGTPAGFIDNAVPPRGDPERASFPDLVFVAACHQVLLGQPDEARRIIAELLDRPEPPEWPEYYAALLLDRLDDLAPAREQLAAWRRERLARIDLEEPRVADN